MPPEIDLSAIPRGSISAPAGCGKTQVIADTLGLPGGPKPVLVLTHTNSGVAALRQRLQRAGVQAGTYRLATIDGFALRLLSMYPTRSGIAAAVLELRNPRADYPAIREAAARLLQGGHLDDALRATYARLLVDEYQDCNLSQHAMIMALSNNLPTCVMGDPMQAIFGFRGNALVDWNLHVLPAFPSSGQLDTPWRWRNAGTERLGRWILACREALARGDGIDLRLSPPEVTWVALQAATADQQRMTAARTLPISQAGHVLVIGDSLSPQSRRLLASRTPGASTVEPVDLGDLTDFARQFDPHGVQAMPSLIAFAAELMTNLGVAQLAQRVDILRRGTARNPATPAETALIALSDTPSIAAAEHALRSLMAQPDVRVYRPEVLYPCLRAMASTAHGRCTFLDAVIRERERNRHEARRLPKRAVGSTLLLKGLEAEVAVIPNPETMDARHLYVALSRASMRLVICSTNPTLGQGA